MRWPKGIGTTFRSPFFQITSYHKIDQNLMFDTTLCCHSVFMVSQRGILVGMCSFRSSFGAHLKVTIMCLPPLMILEFVPSEFSFIDILSSKIVRVSYRFRLLDMDKTLNVGTFAFCIAIKLSCRCLSSPLWKTSSVLSILYAVLWSSCRDMLIFFLGETWPNTFQFDWWLWWSHHLQSPGLAYWKNLSKLLIQA